jgi:hypothetical protein
MEEERDATYIARKLSGHWEGYSIPYDKGRPQTKWTQCTLHFNTHSDHVIILKGQGTSIWKGQLIQFQLNGTLDTHTYNINIQKTHQGDKVKTITYDAHLNFQQRLIQGTYDKGTFVLRKVKKESKEENQRKNSKDIADTLTGKWEGESVRKSSQHVTLWKNVILTFNPAMSRFAGSGISEWKNDQVEFEVSGKFLSKEGDERDAEMIKVNHVETRKELEFRVKVNLKAATIEGDWDKGTVFLKRIGDVDTKEQEAKPDSNDHNLDRLAVFSDFLGIAAASKPISVQQKTSIDKMREKYAISEEEYTSVLQKLSLKSSDLEPEKKTCIICYDREINCGKFEFMSKRIC